MHKIWTIKVYCTLNLTLINEIKILLQYFSTFLIIVANRYWKKKIAHSSVEQRDKDRTSKYKYLGTKSSKKNLKQKRLKIAVERSLIIFRFVRKRNYVTISQYRVVSSRIYKFIAPLTASIWNAFINFLWARRILVCEAAYEESEKEKSFLLIRTYLYSLTLQIWD